MTDVVAAPVDAIVRQRVIEPGEIYVMDFSRIEESGCETCGNVSLFCASLIPQPWMQSKDHLPATDCRCGKRYYSWSKNQSFDCKVK